MRLYFHQVDPKGKFLDEKMNEILQKIKQESDKDLIVILPNVPFIVPRGKY